MDKTDKQKKTKVVSNSNRASRLGAAAAIGLAFSFLAVVILKAAWTEPALPPPDGNPAPPIYSSGANQTLDGSLAVGINDTAPTGLSGRGVIGLSGVGASIGVQASSTNTALFGNLAAGGAGGERAVYGLAVDVNDYALYSSGGLGIGLGSGDIWFTGRDRGVSWPRVLDNASLYGVYVNASGVLRLSGHGGGINFTDQNLNSLLAVSEAGVLSAGNVITLTSADPNQRRITNLASPQDSADAATKAYVDAQAAGGGGTSQFYIYEAKNGAGSASCSSGYHIISFNCSGFDILCSAAYYSCAPSASVTATSLSCSAGRASIVCESDLPRIMSGATLSASPVSGEITSTRLDWTWSNPPQGESVKVERQKDGAAWGVITTLTPITVLTYTDNTITQGSSFNYRVYIFNSGGANSPYSNEAAITSSLSTPTALAVSGGDATSINLSWNDTNTGEDGYKIERQAEGEGGFTEIATAAGNSYTSSGLTTGVQYTYQIRAYRGTNNSAYSNQSMASRAGLAGPTNFRTTDKTISSVDLAWSDNAAGEDGYKLEYWSWDGSNNVTGQQTLTLAANAQSRSVSGLEEGRYYGFKVYAYAGVYTSNEKPEREDYATLRGPTVGFGSELYLDIEAYTTTARTGYGVDMSDGESGFQYTFTGPVYKTVGAISGTGSLTPSVWFSTTGNGPFQSGVQAYRQTGTTRTVYSSWYYSATLSFYDAPTGLSVSRAGSSAAINWTAVGAPYYRVCKSGQPNSPACAYDAGFNYTTAPTVTYTFTGLNPAIRYYYQVCSWSGDRVQGNCSQVSD